MMTKIEQKPVEKLTYEEAYSELEAVVAALEAGEQPLDTALAYFERGQLLTQHCAELLDKAELKVRQLSAEPLKSLEVSE